jgi:hypothetical protein
MWNILTVPRVWYFKCPRQRGMFLLFRQFDILTVTDNVESSYCSYSKNITHCWGQLKYHDVGTVRIFDIGGDG